MKKLSLWMSVVSIVLIQSCKKLERINRPCPTINSLSPGAAKVDEMVTVTGEDFISGEPGFYTVTIGDTTVPVTAVPDANTLKFIVPLTKSGQLTVNLTLAPNCSSNPLNFVYRYTPLRTEKVAGNQAATSCVIATDNCFSFPTGIDIDNQGNLIVADKGNFVIRKVNPSTGSIDATYGKFKPTLPLTCDNFTVPNSTTAILNFPYDVEVDPSGDIYFVEEFNRTLRVLKPGVTAALTQVLLVAGSCSGSVPGSCGSSAISAPYGLAKDNNKICFIDAGNAKMMDLTGNSCNNVNSLLSHGLNQFFRGVEISSARTGQTTIFIADETGQNIKAVTLSNNNTTVLQTNPTGAFSLSKPVALTLDSKGNIFIADQGSDRIYVLYTNGDLDLLAGTSEGYVDNTDALAAKFRDPSGLALNETAGVLYVADTGNNLIRKVTFK